MQDPSSLLFIHSRYEDFPKSLLFLLFFETVDDCDLPKMISGLSYDPDEQKPCCRHVNALHIKST